MFNRKFRIIISVRDATSCLSLKLLYNITKVVANVTKNKKIHLALFSAIRYFQQPLATNNGKQFSPSFVQDSINRRELKSTDHSKSGRDVNWVSEQYEVGHLDGNVSKQNCRILGLENIYKIFEKQMQSSKKLQCPLVRQD